MASVAVRMSDLRGLSEEQVQEKLSSVLRATQNPPNGEVRELDQKILRFEERYGFTSDEMLNKLSSGSLREDSRICDWLMALELKKLIADGSSQTHQAP